MVVDGRLAAVVFGVRAIGSMTPAYCLPSCFERKIRAT